MLTTKRFVFPFSRTNRKTQIYTVKISKFNRPFYLSIICAIVLIGASSFGVVQDYDYDLSLKLFGKWTLVKKEISPTNSITDSDSKFKKITLNFADKKAHDVKIIKLNSDTTVSEVKNTKYKIRLETTVQDKVRKYIMVERNWGMVQFKEDTLILDYSYINKPKEYYIRQRY